jgi:hypothetical protein
MVSMLLRSLAAASLLALPAFGHDGCDRTPARLVVPAARIGVATPFGSMEFRFARPLHRHLFRLEAERYWVGPLFESRVAGHDLCGRPIWQQLLVRPGYWATRTIEVCRCGATRCR